MGPKKDIETPYEKKYQVRVVKTAFLQVTAISEKQAVAKGMAEVDDSEYEITDYEATAL
jgi:hypothetical protein